MPLISLGRRVRMHCDEYDKRQHFIYSFMIMLLAGLWLDLWWAFLFVFLVGLSKEIWDHYWGSGFCWIDMVANLLGISAALPFWLIRVGFS